MNTIFKFPIGLRDKQTVLMPRSARVLSAQLQGGVPCIWAQVESENDIQERHFELYGTGYEIDNSGNSLSYIATLQFPGGVVFHLFERLL